MGLGLAGNRGRLNEAFGANAFNVNAAPAPQPQQGPQSQANPMADQVLCHFMGIPDLSIFGGFGAVGPLDVVSAFDELNAQIQNRNGVAELAQVRDAYAAKPGLFGHLAPALENAAFVQPAPRPMAFGMAA